MPFFSIITVCFNSEKTIRNTLNSVLMQSFQDYEYWLIDGASKDKTLAIIREYEPRFEGRLHWISEPDGGIYEAMNKGLDNAKGEWIGIINSDDEYLPEAFSSVYQMVKQAQSVPDVIFSDMDYIDPNGKVVRSVIGDVKKLWKGMFVNHPTCFVRRKAYEQFGHFDLEYRIVADYDLMQRILHGGGSFLKCEQKLAVFHTGGVSDRNFSSELEKYQVQKKYYPRILCDYCLLRSLYACRIRPVLTKFLHHQKKR